MHLNLQATKDQTFVVLNSIDGWKPAMLVTSGGEQQELTCFDRDDATEADISCSVNWQNQLFIFGGRNETRQISRLSGYKLERVGNLLFDHWAGSCSVMGNEHIFLCFPWATNDVGNRCRLSNGPLEQFSEVALSTHRHRYTQTSCSDSKFLFSTQ